MKETLVVGFDVDGILNKGTTISTLFLLLRKKYNDKLAHVSGDFSRSKQIKEVAKIFLLLGLPLLEEHLRHALRTMDNEVLGQIADFKEEQANRPDLDTKLVIASGRSTRLTGLTQDKIDKAGFKGLFDEFYLRPPGYSSPGWKNHLSDTIAVDTYAQVDDDPFAGHAVLKTAIAGRRKTAFIVNNGVVASIWLMEEAHVPRPSNLCVVSTVSQALVGIATLFR